MVSFLWHWQPPVGTGEDLFCHYLKSASLFSHHRGIFFTVMSDKCNAIRVFIRLSVGVEHSHQLAEVPEDGRSRHATRGDPRGGAGGDEGPG